MEEEENLITIKEKLDKYEAKVIIPDFPIEH
jgi:hypothetical protein